MSAEAWRHSGTDVAPRSFAWQACRFQHLGLDLRGRRGTFCTSMSAEAWRHSGADVAPRSFAWQAWYFLYPLPGRRGTFCTSIDVSGSLATFWD